MKIIKAKWFNDADSPVVLMIDDLNNLWFDIHESGHPELGEDWGYWRDLPGSSFAFLQDNLLNEFPEIKVTFFTIVGALVWEFKYGRTYNGRINENSEISEFFRRVHHSKNLEITYHGLTHGVKVNENYIQEWLSFNSIEEALRNIEEGQRICQEVFGERLKGGKYGGYASNIHSDESIERAGFLWWCRRWTYDDFLKAGNDYSVFEMKTFGRNKVVDFPSTVNPSTFPRNPIKKIAMQILRRPYKSLKAYLDGLLSNKKVISIQEHAGAIKANGIRQTPNIIDDMSVLQHIFSYLRGKNVWYATCSEIANYYIAFTSTQIEEVDEEGFKLGYAGRVEKPWVTLIIDREEPVEVISPSGSRYESIYKDTRRLINIEVENGYYQVRETK
jgi:hypothetical protein